VSRRSINRSPRLVAAEPAAVRAALAAAHKMGMFFRLADPTAEPGDWEPVKSLYGPHDPNAGSRLDTIIESVRIRMGGCERRVAASIFFQGYAARLLSPQLACMAIAGCIPEMPVDQLLWRAPDWEMIELGMTAGTGWQGPTAALVDHILGSAFEAHLNPFAAALRSRVYIAEAVFTDNAAAAVVAGLRLLRPHVGSEWRNLATRALAGPQLSGSGRLREREPVFIRRSCCLYYRVTGGGKCGDCPLGAPTD
jgi:ferric iron reductase protein FhuF